MEREIPLAQNAIAKELKFAIERKENKKLQ